MASPFSYLWHKSNILCRKILLKNRTFCLNQTCLNKKTWPFFTCSNQLYYFFFKRLILNGILKSQIDYLQEFLNVLEERQTARKSSKSNQQAMYAEIPDHHKQLFRRLVSDGMNPTVEDKLLYMKDNLIKIAKHRAMKMVSLFTNQIYLL